jgi:hypothetical protein
MGHNKGEIIEVNNKINKKLKRNSFFSRNKIKKKQ